MRWLSLLLCPVVLFAADLKQSVNAKTVTTYKLRSAATGDERLFNVLLPADYSSSLRRYPVLYLLHGYGDNHTTWSTWTNLSGYAANREMIVVMPDGSRSFFINSAANPEARFEDFIIAELIPYVDSQFRTIPLRRARAIAGNSMGGYGAMILGLKHPGMFAAIGSFSGAVDYARDGQHPASPRDIEIQALFGPDGSADRHARNPFLLVQKISSAEFPMLYLVCGGQDPQLPKNRRFVELLAEKKIPYEYREISPRVHSWALWDEQTPVFLDLLKTRIGFERE